MAIEAHLNLQLFANAFASKTYKIKKYRNKEHQKMFTFYIFCRTINEKAITQLSLLVSYQIVEQRLPFIQDIIYEIFLKELKTMS